SKSRQFRKKVKLRRANLSGVRRTYVRRNDFEMQRNAEIGLFTELSACGWSVSTGNGGESRLSSRALW
ncbi:MAG TPA: hypothetical protein VK852_12045, partial [Desulfobacterales bacterium]|nr:hypothetical protein [Desulfobacterales bacterium]